MWGGLGRSGLNPFLGVVGFRITRELRFSGGSVGDSVGGFGGNSTGAASIARVSASMTGISIVWGSGAFSSIGLRSKGSNSGGSGAKISGSIEIRVGSRSGSIVWLNSGSGSNFGSGSIGCSNRSGGRLMRSNGMAIGSSTGTAIGSSRGW